jgi:glycosyltransferase involved in cell wall biosynthesis
MEIVSVITVIKNNRLGFQKTYESLIKQTHTNWEMLVVAGSSSDGSEKLVLDLQKNDKRIKFALDNSDGIYAAMNQGLEMRTSNLVWFMNSGDAFYGNQTLELTLKQLNDLKLDLIIGGYATMDGEELKLYSKDSRYLSTRDFSLNVRGGCHQSMLLKLNKQNTNLRFNENYLIASDFDYILRFMRNGICFRTSQVLSIIETGGVSSREIHRVILEKQNIRRSFFPNSHTDIFLGQLWSILLRAKIRSRELKSKFTRHQGRIVQ